MCVCCVLRRRINEQWIGPKAIGGEKWWLAVAVPRWYLRLSTRLKMIYHADGDKQSIQSYRIPSPSTPPPPGVKQPFSPPATPGTPSSSRIPSLLSPESYHTVPPTRTTGGWRPKANYELIGARGIYKFKRNFYIYYVIYIILYVTPLRKQYISTPIKGGGTRGGAVSYLWDNVTDGLYFRSRTGPT